MRRSTFTASCEIVYAALVEAAKAGELAPQNRALAALIKQSTGTVTNVIAALESAGRITVRRASHYRAVTITALDISTLEPAAEIIAKSISADPLAPARVPLIGHDAATFARRIAAAARAAGRPVERAYMDAVKPSRAALGGRVRP